ncbi:MAG TPA: hypothetical protein VGX23_06265 [Actinocrinis sp.]|nr:hypothetical protein [Actinocrinis sp.]
MIDQSGELAEPGVVPAARQGDEPRPQRPGPVGRIAALSPARLRAAALILIGTATLFYLYLKVAETAAINSDGSNNALQAWDLLHGHLLLHGWVIGDATYYTFELPIFALCEGVFGLGSEAIHVGDAVIYLLVVVMAALLACRKTSGRTALVRCCIVAAMMAVPITVATILVMLNAPDHIGTCAILLGAVYLADLVKDSKRSAAESTAATGRRSYLPVWLGVVLTLGQLGDQTVLYVGSFSIGLIGAYRMVRARGYRNADGAILLASVLSYPAALLLRHLLRALGGYTMIPPLTQIAPPHLWWSNFQFTYHNLAIVYGIDPGHLGRSTVAGSTVLGWISAAAALAGFLRVIVRWNTVGRGAQILCTAIVVNLASYTVSAIADASNAREIVFTLPAGCVLAAMAWRGPLLERRRAVFPAALALAAAAVVPSAVTAGNSTADTRDIVLSAWLQAHHLTYGIGGYWDASSVSVQSGGAVQVRAVLLYQGRFLGYSWEARANWYDPAENDATFYITNPFDSDGPVTPAEVEAVYGPPTAIYTVDTRMILVYDQNLLTKVRPLVAGTG